jgi:hypothetical protein
MYTCTQPWLRRARGATLAAWLRPRFDKDWLQEDLSNYATTDICEYAYYGFIIHNFVVPRSCYTVESNWVDSKIMVHQSCILKHELITHYTLYTTVLCSNAYKLVSISGAKFTWALCIIQLTTSLMHILYLNTFITSFTCKDYNTYTEIVYSFMLNTATSRVLVHVRKSIRTDWKFNIHLQFY